VNWWRAHHGISHDPKLCLIAKRAKARKCEVLAIWVSILDFASQNESARGSIRGIDPETLSEQTEIPVPVVTRVLAQFLEKEMVAEDGTLAAWDKRQYSDSSTGRVKRFRENKALNTECNGVKQMKQSETVETVVKRPEENRTDTEQNRAEEKNLCAADAAPPFVDLAIVPKKRGATWFDEQHENWYRNAYWRHTNFKASRLAYEKVIRKMTKSDEGFDECAALLFQAAVDDKTRFQGTPDWEWRQNLHPATWLNGERWLDEAKARGQPSVQSKKVGFVESVRQEFGKQLARGEPLC
jgi:hypothetical protein